jgi:hypothetical protein
MFIEGQWDNVFLLFRQQAQGVPYTSPQDRSIFPLNSTISKLSVCPLHLPHFPTASLQLSIGCPLIDQPLLYWWIVTGCFPFLPLKIDIATNTLPLTLSEVIKFKRMPRSDGMPIKDVDTPRQMASIEPLPSTRYRPTVHLLTHFLPLSVIILLMGDKVSPHWETWPE